LSYQWYKDGVTIPNATDATLTFANVQPVNAGLYSVMVSNAYGTLTSAGARLTVTIPASIVVQPVGQVVFAGSEVVFAVVAAGTEPLSYQWHKNAAAIPTATNSSFIIHNANFGDAGNYTVIVSNLYGSQTSQVATLAVKVVPNFVLNDLTPGGGIVMPEPFQSSFPPNSFVTLTAKPANGWTFLDWKGSTQGTNPVATLQMTYAKTVQARFGTAITVTPSGNGSVSVVPSSELYPYDTSVRIVAEPQPGNYFAGWSGSVEGNANPVTMIVRDANPVVFGFFDALPVGRAALTLIPEGYGEVSVMPQANTYTTGQTVTNVAIPNDGQEFLGWSGDASGTNNPLVVTMNQSKVITASFTKRPRLDIQALDMDGLLVTLTGEFSGSYRILSSTDLVNWVPYLTLTNAYGKAQIIDPPTTNQCRFYRAVASAQAQRTATAVPTVVNGFVVAITVTDGGAGYTSPPVVTISGGGGSGAVAVATVLNGAVDKVIVENAGSGYTSTPTVVVATPPSP
jgi:hypothetical protein